MRKDTVTTPDIQPEYICPMFSRSSMLFLVLDELLKDHSTGGNIVWATDTYECYGPYYAADHEMSPVDVVKNLIYGSTQGTMQGTLFLPRVLRAAKDRQQRTKQKAEVFTPSWVVNMMNNYIMDEYFGRTGVFNTENDDHTWTVNDEKVAFPDTKVKRGLLPWQQFVDLRMLEITCGEAPYLVSRYDTTTGQAIAIHDRIGLLDRKIRVVNENASDNAEWMKWVIRAYEATYGYEFQGDNLFFARANMVQTFIEYYQDRYGKEPDEKMVKKIARIVSWNVWQMDGLKDTVPYGKRHEKKDGIEGQRTFGDDRDDTCDGSPVYARIMDWRGGSSLEFREMKGEKF